MTTTMLLIAVIVMALIFDYINGWNDSANAIATVVSTRVLTPAVAVIFAASLNFIGALTQEKVAGVVSKEIIDPQMVTLDVVLAAMMAAAAWVAFCTMLGLPISGTHSLIGGMIGAAVALKGMDVVIWSGTKKTLIGLVVSPVLGFFISYVLLVIVYWIANAMSRNAVRKTFSWLQIASSGFMAFSHGLNDAQKVMGAIMLALTSGRYSATDSIPVWVKLLCATMMGLGTAAGGWKVIKTLGMKLAHIRPIEGFAAETGAGFVLTVIANFGVPVSTTHTITGSVLGVGAAYRAKSVKWGIGARIVYAWVFTLPAAAVLAATVALILEPLLAGASAR